MCLPTQEAMTRCGHQRALLNAMSPPQPCYLGVASASTPPVCIHHNNQAHQKLQLPDRVSTQHVQYNNFNNDISTRHYRVGSLLCSACKLCTAARCAFGDGACKTDRIASTPPALSVLSWRVLTQQHMGCVLDCCPEMQILSSCGFAWFLLMMPLFDTDADA